LSSRRQISELLKQLRAEGRFDSSGNFTVELKRALQKRTRYELDDFESAVLKLIQAGVAGESLDLAVTESPSEMVFSAREVSWNRSQVFESLYRPGKNNVAGALHLGQALRFLLKHCPSGVLIEFSEPPAYFWKNDRLEEREIELVPPNGFRLSLSVEPHNERISLGQGSLSRELFGRCHYCPVPLTFDRKKVNGFSNDPRGGVIPGIRIPFAQIFWETNYKWFSRFELTAGIDETPLRVSQPSAWSSKDVFPKHCSLAAFLTANLDGAPQPSFLLWTYDGVVVKRESLPPLGCIGATMILCGDDLSVDLSGLNLGEGQIFELQRREALVLVKQALIELAESSGGLVFEEDEDSVLEIALSLVGLRKKLTPELGPVELNMLESHLRRLGDEYWSP
jgi:hypothetical protein